MIALLRPTGRPCLVGLVLAALVAGLAAVHAQDAQDPAPREHVDIRGIYGRFPEELLTDGRTLAGSGVNAVFVGSRAINADLVARARAQGVRVFAEFNTLHVARYLEDHPDAAPVGADGEVCPPPHDWQGICPTHEAYRRFRVEAFRAVLAFEIDGVWLDYHHAHASWERAEPALPDTCFCRRCVTRFAADTGVDLDVDDVDDADLATIAALLLGEHRERWVAWRCGVFTDWVREFRAILDEVRPDALLGTFHCPWDEAHLDGALRAKLAIDLKAQAAFVDVFSIMPYHARFGHADDPAWISRRTAWLGEHLGITGGPDERNRIWPIVQLSDWGEAVDVEQVAAVLDHGTRAPSTGVMVFHWGNLRRQPAKVEAMAGFYRAIRSQE